MEILGITFSALLIAGFGWALIDLLIKIHKQPKRPISMLRLTSYPFVPDDETLEAARNKEEERLGHLQPSPVRVEATKNTYR